MDKNVLEISNLNKTFGSKKVIDNVSFSVQAGDIFGFLGPNGAGKTTTIRMILNLIHKDSGTVKINGYDTKTEPKQALKNIGAIVETPKFYNNLSAYQNLVVIANYHSELSASRIDEVLKIVGLATRAKEKVKNYSLGMKQRLGLARALLNSPRLVFLDEPTNGLDPEGIIEIRELITRLANEQGITFFITTHLLNEVEQICNKVAILQEGKLIIQSTVEELLQKDSETVEIYTFAVDKVAGLIKGLDYVNSIWPSDNGLEIEIEKGYSSKLLDLLIKKELTIDYLVPKKQTLEHFFIELTKGGDEYVTSN